MRSRFNLAVIMVLGMAGLAGCGVFYTNPTVSTGFGLGNATDALKIDVVPITYESTVTANLTPYVPARLPLGFQPDAVQDVLRKASASAPALRAPPAPPSRPGARPGTIPDRLPPLIEPQPYRIGVADVLLLSVNTANATLEQLPGVLSAQSGRQGFVVQDDGAIAMPNAGRILVSGMTMQDAEAAIFQALISAGIDPAFSLEIAEFNSQRVSVGGEVRAPALVPITLKPLFLHEAINSAGGVAYVDTAVAKVQLFRNGQTYQISGQRFERDPAARKIVLQDGDSIFVKSDFAEERARNLFQEQIAVAGLEQERAQASLQIATTRAQLESNELSRLREQRQLFLDRVELGAVQRDYAYLAGEVGTPVRVALPFEQTAVLADVLFTEENRRGLNINFSDYGEIYVLRRSSNPEELAHVTAYHLDASNAVNLALAGSFNMHAGDVVFVAEQPITAWNRALTQILPTLFFSAANAASGF